LEAFQLVTIGKPTDKPGDQLVLSTKRFGKIRASLMTKLGVNQRAELVQRALQMGLLSAPVSER